METAVITKKHKIIMTCVVVCIGIILWGTLKAGWGNPELAGMFAFMGIFAGFVDGLKPSEIAEEFVKGAAGITMGALVVGLARAILVIVQDAMIIDTIIYYAASLLEGLPSVLAAQGMLLLTSIINFFIPSSTGAASVSIPILAPIGDFLGVSRQVTCLAFQFGDGFSNNAVAYRGHCSQPRYFWYSFRQMVEILPSFVCDPICCSGDHPFCCCTYGHIAAKNFCTYRTIAM